MSPIRISLAVLCVVAFASSCLAAAGTSGALKKQEHQRQQQPTTRNCDNRPIWFDDESEIDDRPIWPSGETESDFNDGKECAPGEEHQLGISPRCEPTCSEPSPICPKIFYRSRGPAKCFCKEGTVRNEKTGKCVRLEECPRAIPMETESVFNERKKCSPGEILIPFMLPSCEETCSNPGGLCIKLPYKGPAKCFCKEGTVRNEKTGKCVHLAECPRAIPMETEIDDRPIWPGGETESVFNGGKECAPGQEHQLGRSPRCEPTCSEPSPICPKIFYRSRGPAKCFCKEGAVRNEKTGKCVRLEECPKAS